MNIYNDLLSYDVKIDFTLWPDGVIPYRIDGPINPQTRFNLIAAISDWENATNLDFIETREADSVWVDFRESTGPVGSAPVGRILVSWDSSWNRPFTRTTVTANGREIDFRVFFSLFSAYKYKTPGANFGPDCDILCLLHELGHMVGLLHEHQRWDRDRFIRIPPSWISGVFGYQENDAPIRWLVGYSNRVGEPVRGIPYDYTSIMHYPIKSTIPPGIPVGHKDLSVGDILGVNRMYDFHTSETTVIETNPPNLQIIVDGRLVDTPYHVNWTKGSEHTLEAPLVQFSGSRHKRYLFGNWGGSGRASSTPTRIHVTADGIASLWYQANFIVQDRIHRGRQGYSYSRPWIYDASEPPSYSETYEKAQSYWDDRIAVWPQAFTFVQDSISEPTRQSFWITNVSDETKTYRVSNLGQEVLGLEYRGFIPLSRRRFRIKAKQTKKVEIAIRDPQAYREGSYDSKIGVCELDDQYWTEYLRAESTYQCVDLPVRYIVVPPDVE